MLTLTNEDNALLIGRYPDKHFKIAIVDPPYGINFSNYNRTNKDDNGKRFKANKYKNSDWDNGTPKNEYFKELIRVSEKQIVWGGNYFMQLAGKEYPNLKTIEQFNKYICESDQKWLFWHKQNPVPNFADGELAWLSPNLKTIEQFDFKYYGNLQGNTTAETKIHPTQKPVELYKFLLHNYADPGDNVLDTHLGSGSIAIACHDYKYDLTACELDPEIFEKAIKRIQNYTSQCNLFA